MAGMQEEALLGWLDQQHDAMVALLAELVAIDSGSYHKPGIDRMAAQIARFFASEEIEAEELTCAGKGTGLRVRLESGGAGGERAQVLLLGHLDTVFPVGEAARRPFRIEGSRAYGPGVADMKAGLVMNAFLLAAFRRFGVPGGRITGLFTIDEEIASPVSRHIIAQEARGVRAVFNTEPGRPSGNVVVARKGALFLRLSVTGRAAHAGVNPRDGASAIAEIARKIVALERFGHGEVTVNVGLVRGGQSINTVAPHAEAEIDIRFTTAAERDSLMEGVSRLARQCEVAGTEAEFTLLGEFSPMVPDDRSRDLFSHYQQAAAAVGLTVDGERTGGCSDSGFTSMVGAPTLCAVGPIGGLAHSADEYLELDSMVPRAKALALAIARL